MLASQVVRVARWRSQPRYVGLVGTRGHVPGSERALCCSGHRLWFGAMFGAMRAAVRNTASTVRSDAGYTIQKGSLIDFPKRLVCHQATRTTGTTWFGSSSVWVAS